MRKIQKTPKWSSTERDEYITRAKNGKYDVIIVGGGITGAGIARELAIRGFSFLLLEKVDFAFGTSSKSSKLVHGGMRYMSNKQFKVTRESCLERNWMRTHFPNLVRPEPFYMLSYEGSSMTPEITKTAFTLYNVFSDKLSKYKNYAKPIYLTKEEMLAEAPYLNKDKLLMAGRGYENNVDDARLTLETIKEALIYSEGKSQALNYSKVESFLLNDQGKVIGVNVKDELTDKLFTAKGTQVVNATGIWTDELLREDQKYIRPSKGVHVVVANEQVGTRHMFSVKSPVDGRSYFIIQREKFTVIGTTDTDYKGDLDNPVCTKEEFEYLIEGVNRMFTDIHITQDDVVSTYAGIRPLVIDPHAKNESEVSRKHVIVDHQNGVVSMIGGKLTIFRKMGEELVYHLIKNEILPKAENGMMKKAYSKIPFLVGLTRKEFDDIYAIGLAKDEYPKLDEELLEYLYRQYGKQSFEIMTLIKEDPAKGHRLFDGVEFIPADIEWICDHEFAPRLLDVINRRTEMSLYVHHSHKEDLANKVGVIMQEKYGWNEDRLKEEIQTYIDQVNSWLWF